MKKTSFLIIIMLFVATMSSKAQDFVLYDGDTVCALDSKGLKQGEWLFYNANGSISMACSFRNDSLVDNRVFYEGKNPWLVRFSTFERKEAFTFITANKRRINGYFEESTGKPQLENAADSIDCPLDTLVYFVGIPGRYLSTTVSAEVQFNGLCLPLKQKYFDNKATIIFAIKANGLVESVQVQLQNKNKKLEKELLTIASQLRRWQPAFRMNRTEPFSYTIHENFDKK